MSCIPRRLAVCVAVGALAGSWAHAQSAGAGCGNPLVNQFGPYDYRVEHGRNRKIVEDYHFTARVEALASGISASLGADIDYTLRAFPNHHRALVSMMNLGARFKVPQPPGAQFTVDCYFKRALLFRPDDLVVRMIYAKYLAGNGRRTDAVRELEYVSEQAKDNGFTQYNAGLVYFEMGELDKALAQAHRALALGFERPGLQQQLEAAGVWTDPPPAAAPEAGASAAAPASAASR